MDNEFVVGDEVITDDQSSGQADIGSDQVIQTVALQDFEELTYYYDLQVALSCIVIGLLLMLLIALSWVREL